MPGDDVELIDGKIVKISDDKAPLWDPRHWVYMVVDSNGDTRYVRRHTALDAGKTKGWIETAVKGLPKGPPTGQLGMRLNPRDRMAKIRRPPQEELPVEPNEEDIVVGDRGYEAFYAGKMIAEASNRSDDQMGDLAVEIVDWMGRNKYWPDVWYADDHGGWHLWSGIRREAETRNAELNERERLEEERYAAEAKGNPNYKYTAGPWEYGNGEIWSPQSEQRIAWMGISKNHGTEVSHNEQLANSMLVAAAPELLEALEAVVSTYRTFRNVPKSKQEWTPIDDEAIEAGFAAIAKARGGGARRNPGEAHTPGPWVSAAGNIGDHSYYVAAGRYDPKSGITFYDEHVAWVSKRADAQLIALAPELLTSVERMLPWMGKLISDKGHLKSVLPRDAVMAMEQGLDLLAKAKGKDRQSKVSSNPMKLMTKEIERKARAQYPKGSSLEGQMVVAKFFDPQGSWTWYLMNQDPEDPDYLWGIVSGFEVEMGSFSLKELSSVRGGFGLGIERDLYFHQMPAKEVWDRLNAGEHI